VAAVLDAMRAGAGPQPRSPLLALCDASLAAEAAIDVALAAEQAICEPWVAHHISACVADDEMLFTSNSLPIRHVDNFCATTPLVLSNRGASGIDGIVHTAIGMALGCGTRCTLLVGDLATLHDLNALATLSKQSIQLVIVVLNNGGGGIFRFLPIASHDGVFSPFFDTPHDHDFRGCCQAFGIQYSCATTPAEFKAAFDEARAGSSPHVVEVDTSAADITATVGKLRSAASQAGHQAFEERAV